jgi:nucleoside-diphosphate kinase
LAIIKPHVLNKAAKSGAPGKIVDGILKHGFDISDMQLFHLDRVNAEEFYEVYKTVVPEFHVRLTVDYRHSFCLVDGG